MVRKLTGEVLEQYDRPQRDAHWKRERKAKIDFFDESPFAIDRQLEDQKYQMKFNKNPQLKTLMRSDAVRSELLFEKKDAEDSAAIKAKVVNKIVRQYSGVNSYALVPPPRVTQKESTDEIDPDTHPRLKVYAKEAQLKPIICSFGHRPSSASRTFHPATMKIKLKHGEIIKTTPQGGTHTESKTGLSVAVLSKLLYAPKIYHTSGVQDEDALDSLFGPSEVSSSPSKSQKSVSAPATVAFDPNDLFSLPATGSPSAANNGEDEGESAIDMLTSMKMFTKSKKAQTASIKKTKANVIPKPKKKKEVTDDEPEPIGSISLAPLSVTGGIDRPLWVDGFHTIEQKSSEKYNLKHSVITEGSQDIPLNERLNRFATKTVAEKQLMPTCQERQLNDIYELSGQKVKPPKAEPVKGQVLYYDPLDKQLQDVISYRENLVRQREERIRAKLYQDSLKTIPDVPYNAISTIIHSSSNSSFESSQLHHHSGNSVASGSIGGMQSISSIGSKASQKAGNNNSNNGSLTSRHTKGSSNVSSEDLRRVVTEGLTQEAFMNAYKAAKRGDSHALYQHFMTTNPSQESTMGSVSGGDIGEQEYFLDDNASTYQSQSEGIAIDYPNANKKDNSIAAVNEEGGKYAAHDFDIPSPLPSVEASPASVSGRKKKSRKSLKKHASDRQLDQEQGRLRGESEDFVEVPLALSKQSTFDDESESATADGLVRKSKKAKSRKSKIEKQQQEQEQNQEAIGDFATTLPKQSSFDDESESSTSAEALARKAKKAKSRKSKVDKKATSDKPSTNSNLFQEGDNETMSAMDKEFEIQRREHQKYQLELQKEAEADVEAANKASPSDAAIQALGLKASSRAKSTSALPTAASLSSSSSLSDNTRSKSSKASGQFAAALELAADYDDDYGQPAQAQEMLFYSDYQSGLMSEILEED